MLKFEIKEETGLKLEDLEVIPKGVTTKKKRKPRLKYRPENGTVLNLEAFDADKLLKDQDIDMEDVSFVNHAFMNSNKLICVAGAGISVGAGIPDFRSSDGFFNSLNNGQGKNLFDYQSVYRDSETMSKFHEMIFKLYQMSLECQPTLFHQFLNYIAGDDRLLRLYTQNVDSFELQMPYLQTDIPLTMTKPPPRCIQLHGNVQIMNCTKCHYKMQLDPNIFRNLTLNSPPPTCPECEEMDSIREIAGKRKLGCGTLRPRIVLYNEFHPDGEVIGHISQKDLKAKPDCLIIVGTTLKIPGVRILVRELTRTIHSSKGCVIWINTEEPSTSVVDFLEYLDLIIVGDCQDIPKLLVKYACEITKVQNDKKRQNVKKVLATRKLKQKNQASIDIQKNGSLNLKNSKINAK